MKKPSTWIIIILLVALFLALAENRSFSDERDRLNAKIKELQQECDQQYDKGYEAGRNAEQLEGVTYYDSPYYEIDDMTDREIIDYLKRRFSWATKDELIDLVWEPLIGD